MPVRAIIKPAIYTEKRFSCACRAITISLKTPSRDIFRRFGGFWRIRCKLAPVWLPVKAMPHGSDFYNEFAKIHQIYEKSYRAIEFSTKSL